MIDFPVFLKSLFEDGRLRAPAFGPISDTEGARGDRVLASFEQEYRLDLPGRPPPFDPPAGRWAAELVYRACQFLVFRGLDEPQIVEVFSIRCPGNRSPAVHYSVDLTLRFLPDLIRMSRTTSREDPLTKQLIHLAAQWPLSSVGIPDLGPISTDTFADDPCLLALYADRIISTKDRSRLNDPRVAESVRTALGLHDDLAPDLAAALPSTAPRNNGQRTTDN